MAGQGIHLVVGSDGAIGSALCEYLSDRGEIAIGTVQIDQESTENRIHLDLEKDISGWEAPKGVKAAYLCAAVASLEACRKDPERTSLINVKRTVALGKKLVDAGAFVIFPSTNLVFDGAKPGTSAQEPTTPETEYGRQKARAEKELLALEQGVAVVRLPKVLSPQNKLLRGWISALKKGEEIRPFSDMPLSPVSMEFVLEVFYRTAVERRQGIIQVSADRDITYSEMAGYIAKKLGVPHLVKPVASMASGLELEAIPANTTLDTYFLKRELGLEPDDPWVVVDKVVSEILESAED